MPVHVINGRRDGPKLFVSAALLRADAPMVEARVLDAAHAGDHAPRHVVRRPRATLTRLRLRDGTLIVKVSRGRRTQKSKAQIAL